MSGDNLDLTLLRSQRKTIGIEVKITGEVVVRAPRHISVSKINSFVSAKYDWIEKHKNNALLYKQKYPNLTYKDGESVYLYGAEYTLRKRISDRTQILFNNNTCHISHTSYDIKEPLTMWYKNHAKSYINDRVIFFAEKHKFDFKSIRITNARTRWGSCGSSNSLNFSWRLIKTPKQVIDYVVVHELVHTEIKNHSQSYWSRVHDIYPEYEMSREWLKVNAVILLRD